MNKLWLPLALLLALTGCGLTPQGDLVRGVIKVRGAAIADQGLTNAEWFVCEAATIGSVKRKYGRTTEDADTYRKFCPGGVDVDLITSPPLPE